MFLTLFLKGWLIGFSIAMPVGPIGLLCIRNTLAYGLLCGLMTGLGAALADALYGAIAGFGITAVSDFLSAHRLMLQFAGALFLCYLGIATFFAKTSTTKLENRSRNLPRVFGTTFLLTLTNPMTILSFAAIYAGLGIGNGAGDNTQALTLTLGVFIGSAVWWILLSATTLLLKKTVSESFTIWLNRVSGALLFSFGLAAFVI